MPVRPRHQAQHSFPDASLLDPSLSLGSRNGRLTTTKLLKTKRKFFGRYRISSVWRNEHGCRTPMLGDGDGFPVRDLFQQGGKMRFCLKGTHGFHTTSLNQFSSESENGNMRRSTNGNHTDPQGIRPQAACSLSVARFPLRVGEGEGRGPACFQAYDRITGHTQHPFPAYDRMTRQPFPTQDGRRSAPNTPSPSPQRLSRRRVTM